MDDTFKIGWGLVWIIVAMCFGMLMGEIAAGQQTDRAIICMEAGNTADFCRGQAQILKD